MAIKDLTTSQARPPFPPRRPSQPRRKPCPFSGPNAPKIDYKDVRLLQRYVSERGKIVPSRITAVSALKQRLLAQGNKRARFIVPLPAAGPATVTDGKTVVTIRKAGETGQLYGSVSSRDIAEALSADGFSVARS